ncbi:MAG TPA: CPBP family intramembrane glutamic endopeptidase [Acidobacteriota bacterium]|nr:CPBP family intramembrane glutamic endopeptidase [Acidobacteriota bacterium]
MRFNWPPKPLGLGTPLNLASVKDTTRRLILENWWQAIVLGIVTPIIILGVDQLLFAGISLQRVRTLGSVPFPTRLLIIVYSAVTEELIYRVLISTLFAWIAYRLTLRFFTNARNLSQWIGIAIGAFFFGLAHAGTIPNLQHPIIRAVTLNGIAGLVLGWLYWWRGLELGILTHLIADTFLYSVVPFFI